MLIERLVGKVFWGGVWLIRRAKCSLFHHQPINLTDRERNCMFQACERCGKDFGIVMQPVWRNQ